jgi:hypothetical protein
MNFIISQNLINRLPEDVIRENILPYTYNTQPRELIIDIRTYLKDYGIVINYYAIYMNDLILRFDLIQFLSFLNKYHADDVYGKATKSRILFGRLTPFERTQFINQYILVFPW